MMRARVAFSGAIHTATPGRKPDRSQDQVEGLQEQTEVLLLDDGRLVSGAEVVWLPPFEVGTIIALGLNYADHAKELVAGYCIANDYAIRDYLENWYRPNLRVKNRDGGTVLGPWFVDASDVPDPANLSLRTHLNGELKQQGNTRDLIFDIPYLIEYLSAFMTLAPGDVILTGTPEGVANVMPGDEIVCEIDGLGRLVNTIVADEPFGR